MNSKKSSKKGPDVRVILYSGKGGVGKTTVSAATGLRTAELGRKTVLISTDQAHSLSDILEVELSGSPTEVAPGLDALEIDLDLELRNYWGEIQNYVSTFFRGQGFEELVAEEFAILPGLEELFSLLKLNQLVREKEYEVVIIDCAPTGNTIRMLSFPDMIRWYMEKFYPRDRMLFKLLRPLAEKISKVPLPNDQLINSAETLYQEVQEAAKILTNPAVASVRLVANPEKIVLRETERALTYLCLFGYSVDGVIVNRVLQDSMGSEALKSWQAVQNTYLERTRSYFYPLPVLVQPLNFGEILGIPSLREVAHTLFGEKDPARVMYNGQPISIKRVKGGYLLSIKLPAARREEIELWRKGDELVLKYQGVKRNIFLPRTLAALTMEEAEFGEQTLRLSFQKKEEK
ncbi:MAG: TRC40/GET3/ArsA family transport-energizing ATPase [Proteobacteria bacterium]|nr:TRC40/GET3/ArsA family transport-energizing ATPase [Pseudomonadota bacterium]